MQITISASTIITAAAVLSAIIAIGGVVFAIYRWYLKQNKQNTEIQKMKEENTLLCFGISAALDGLIQLGANHNVTKAKEKLDKYLNQKAHD